MDKKLFKIIFYDEGKNPLTIYAERFAPSDIIGMAEASGLVFVDPSDIILTPEDDKIKSVFKDVARVFIPVSHLIRVDELFPPKKTPVISIKDKTARKEP